jgi:adenylate cyclase
VAEDRVQRRLAAVLVADVVGYSRLMGANEAATLKTFKRHRQELIDAKFAEHQGRVVKLTGDGMLVEFPSVVDAVGCAAEIQRGMLERNRDVPNDERMELRVGVTVGDVIVEGDDIFGDGVNVAARLESIARPGGIVISATVRDHIGNRLNLDFEDMGEQALKNIERPVRVFGVLLGEPLSHLPLVTPKAAAYAKPSIVVLPFTNMSGDSEQEYFADGITEDIITDLSKVSGLSVIARNSVFTYKGRPADAQEVSRRFRVSHILEGSVRKSGQRVRINAQLVDGRGGTHLWADRYDRDLTDIFTIQDEITKTIIEQLKVTLLPREKQAIETAPTQSINAYDYYLQGRHLFHLHTEAHIIVAQRWFKKALELDACYARAYAGLAYCCWFLYTNDHAGTSVNEIFEASAKAVQLDPELAEGRAAHGVALDYLGRYPEAVVEFERAIAIDPNLFEAHYFYGYAAHQAGDLQTAIRMNERACEIDPEDHRVRLQLVQWYADVGRVDESLEMARSAIERVERLRVQHPEMSVPVAYGAGALIALGELSRARDWAADALMIAPDDPITLYNVACNYAQLGDVDRTMEVLERWRPHSNPRTKAWLRADSDFDRLRSDPRFQEFLDRL